MNDLVLFNYDQEVAGNIVRNDSEEIGSRCHLLYINQSFTDPGLFNIFSVNQGPLHVLQ